MRYVALASDYDGTLAHDGIVAPNVVRVLEQLRQSGRKLILVTGRELPDLERTFAQFELFDRIVAENGALVYDPRRREKELLGQRPPQKFVETLRRNGVSNISAGDVIVAMWRPDEKKAIDAIRELGLELQIIFNKDAVMVLPSGVNKSTGLAAALAQLGLSRHNVVGVGDAENDHAFLSCCECAVAVANAIPALKDRADFTTRGDHGEGVIELSRQLLDNDLADVRLRHERHRLVIGTSNDRDIELRPWNNRILICGQSGSGKSGLVTALIEQIRSRHYQICLIDPEGDYSSLEGFVTTGDSGHPPSLDHLAQFLDDPEAQITVNLTGVSLGDRGRVLGSVLMLIEEQAMRAGRPHWLVIDEVHHMLPAGWAAAPPELGGQIANVVLVTVHPEHVSPIALKRIETVVVLGREPRELLAQFARATNQEVPQIPAQYQDASAIYWMRDSGEPIAISPVRSSAQHERHRRKYAEGNLDDARAFAFRGPRNQLNLKARNLKMFTEMASGIDNETWQFHLIQGDYSRWFDEAIKDHEIAGLIRAIETDPALSGETSRERVLTAIERKYTAAA